ncbi:MAG: hypothetical protein EOM25_10955 [Deltaproteobacteria bacterium]|nr:hypothetical protein [Deltaproteobacteria bacterium]
MKYKNILFFCLMVVLLGCSTRGPVTPNDSATSHAVVCDRAGLVVTVDPSLEFVGRIQKTMSAKHEPTVRTYTTQVFIRADSNRRVQALAVVEEAGIEDGIWLDETSNRYDLHRQGGRFGSWEYRGRVNIFCGNDYYVEQFLKENGYVMDECLLYSVRSGLLNFGRNEKLSVQYAEPVDDDEVGNFFGDEFRLKGKDKFVREFYERSQALLGIVASSD